MKAYTSIEQSKKIAEILPLESADGYWFKGFPSQPYMVYTKGTPNPGEHISCWSLATLINIINENYYTTLYHDGVAWNIDIIHHDNVKEKHSVYANTPVDACYEILLKLYKRNLL